jgi:hypothetical protein
VKTPLTVTGDGTDVGGAGDAVVVSDAVGLGVGDADGVAAGDPHAATARARTSDARRMLGSLQSPCR